MGVGGGVAEKFIQGNPDEFFGQPNITQLIINRRWEDLSYWIPQKEVSLDILHSKQSRIAECCSNADKKVTRESFHWELQVTITQLTKQISKKDG